jgi:hypothetical protein
MLECVYPKGDQRFIVRFLPRELENAIQALWDWVHDPGVWFTPLDASLVAAMMRRKHRRAREHDCRYRRTLTRRKPR